ncbi:hypothetical protein C8D77_11329 [Mesorhizobium loti]|uniref:Uncharacterized protein n=1 Tax=Rhizobium loti TaxID=381 RepID=A0A8E2WAK9_RHILI|nr:hypothetical protein C8D77_11329 [Mesorhizobium loti]
MSSKLTHMWNRPAKGAQWPQASNACAGLPHRQGRWTRARTDGKLVGRLRPRGRTIRHTLRRPQCAALRRRRWVQTFRRFRVGDGPRLPPDLARHQRPIERRSGHLNLMDLWFAECAVLRPHGGDFWQSFACILEPTLFDEVRPGEGTTFSGRFSYETVPVTSMLVIGLGCGTAMAQQQSESQRGADTNCAAGTANRKTGAKAGEQAQGKPGATTDQQAQGKTLRSIRLRPLRQCDGRTENPNHPDDQRDEGRARSQCRFRGFRRHRGAASQDQAASLAGSHRQDCPSL